MATFVGIYAMTNMTSRVAFDGDGPRRLGEGKDHSTSPSTRLIEAPKKASLLRYFFLVTIAASKDKKKAIRAAEEGFEIVIGPQKLTRFEKARIVGARSLQLAMGAPSFVPIDESIRDSIALAMTELASDALPISIRRSLPNGHSQDIPIKYLL
jgi:DNA-directed RNA polymerase subunit K/omega